ncbi:RHS repeat domain-containing protein [Flavobacterium piscinae]|nr:RHS repeat-associated core domain-containing protein [Flavobacterium piscinae]
MRQYTYSYDGLNRLILANYRKPESSIYNSGSYNEAINYDKNGNIESLQRNGEYDDINQNLVIDDLVYTYSTISPNQLLKVEDNTNNPNGFKDGTNTGNDYTYDANGNMTADHNKGITAIKYNHLNLPTQITFATSGNISYIYNATGVKVRKVATEGSTVTTTDYLTGFQYINNKLEFFPHAEGYVKNVIDEDTGFGTTNNIYRYVFNYTDHLGNVRLTYTKHPITNVLTILEENNYYPFGLKHRNYNMNKKDYEKLAGTGGIEITPTNLTIYDYKYNGKEWQDELGLNFYDFGARNYDPAIGRWMNIDPLAEKYRRWSNYNYCMNNPVYFIDPDGMQIDLSAAKEYDKKNETKIVDEIIEDLSEQTGLTYEIVDEKLEYKKDKDGNAIISKDKDGKEIGSRIARGLMIKAIDNPKVGLFKLVDEGGSNGEGLNFKIDVNEVNNFISGASDALNNKTMGFGMTFMHEALHTDLLYGEAHGSESVKWGETGRIVNTMNSIRKELGSSYGQRLSYLSFNSFIPFDLENKNYVLNHMKSLQQPALVKLNFLYPREGKFIKF